MTDDETREALRWTRSPASGAGTKGCGPTPELRRTVKNKWLNNKDAINQQTLLLIIHSDNKG